MNLNLELPAELENELLTEARQLKLPLAEYIVRVLSFRPLLQDPPKTGLELVAYWESVGVIGSRPEITDSQGYAERLRSDAETREGSVPTAPGSVPTAPGSVPTAPILQTAPTAYPILQTAPQQIPQKYSERLRSVAETRERIE